MTIAVDLGRKATKKKKKKKKKEHSVSRQWMHLYPDQTQRSDLGLLCFPIAYKHDARLTRIWVKIKDMW